MLNKIFKIRFCDQGLRRVESGSKAATLTKWAGIFLLTFFLLMLLAATGPAEANELVTYVEDKLLEPAEVAEVAVFVQDEDGELLELDADIMTRLDGEGMVAGVEDETILEMLAGELEFIYQAPEMTNREQLFLFESERGIGDNLNFRIVEDREESRRELAAEIVQIVGDVLMQREEEEDWQTARVGAELKEGDAVQTLAESRVKLTTFEEAEIMIEPETTVEFLELEAQEERREVKRARLQLMDGEVVSRVRDLLNRGSRFTIETDSVTAGVRGTTFRLSYEPDEDLKDIFVYSGEVKVTNELRREAYIVREAEQLQVDDPGTAAELSAYEGRLDSEQDLEEISELQDIDEEDIIDEPPAPEEEKEEAEDVEAEDEDKEEKDEEDPDVDDGTDDEEDGESGVEIDPEW